MREPATALTDFLLAVLATILAVLLLRRRTASGPIGPLLFFLGFADAALFGGIEHGFFSGEQSFAQRITWWLTMVFTGVAASGLAVIGLELLGARNRRLLLGGCLAFIVAFAVYTWSDPRFVAGIVVSSIASVLCLAGALHAGLTVPPERGDERRGALYIAIGIGLSGLGAYLQQQGFAIDPPHFDHNATYHLWLLPALGFLYAGCLRTVASYRT